MQTERTIVKMSACKCEQVRSVMCIGQLYTKMHNTNFIGSIGVLVAFKAVSGSQYGACVDQCSNTGMQHQQTVASIFSIVKALVSTY
jgi:hypothetical protein